MKVILLAGGYGTRISEETSDKPKPMVLIGSKPILWHVMNIYAQQGFTDFIIAGGYRFDVIDNWVRSTNFNDWQVSAVDTGLDTQTGGRIRQCMEIIGEEPVFVTYGDGLGNIPVAKVLGVHKSRGLLATVSAVHPPARFGVVEIKDGLVTHFGEKEHTNVGWINGGFFVLEPEVINYIHNDNEPFEKYTLPRLVADNQLGSFEHQGFWQPMDTLREKNLLEAVVSESIPPWLQFEN
jgi:glucose-1-phosphate cytidylyltransferase